MNERMDAQINVSSEIVISIVRRGVAEVTKNGGEA